MKAIALAGLMSYTFGAFAYGALAVVWVRQRMGRKAADAAEHPPSNPVIGALILVSVVWFSVNAALLLLRFAGLATPWPLDIAILCLAFAYPPIIVHLEYDEARQRTQGLAPGWRLAIVGIYAAAILIPAASFVVFASASTPAIRSVANAAVTFGLGGLFVIAAASATVLGRRRKRVVSTREQRAQRWMASLFGLTIGLFVSIMALSASTAAARPALVAAAIEVLAKSLPLIFFFVATYHENRFEFFDLFVKRGLSLAVAIGVLTGWLALTRPLLGRLEGSWPTSWLQAIVLLPAAVSLPWIFARVGAIVDRRWLGRRFSAEEAVKHFLAALGSATTEVHLVERAQAGLTEVFGAPAAVALGAEGGTAFAAVQDVPIRASGTIVGRFRLGPRDNDMPYFSQDLALAGSLADVFAHVLDNLRLQAREQAQERRTRELTLHASRSELKALRAQINPHFLFNALNSIAGLIHRDPAVADRTIEQLADVFRYALRGAESEWAVLDDELEFVRAYLEVERARFGTRFQASVRLAADVRGARIPTMVVQTLVENAVKHGAGALRGPAVVEVDARHEAGHLVVSVTDNGPGFHDGPSSTRGTGYGLVNVRQRLDGYFGAEAALDVRRDVERRLTVVSVSLPLITSEPSSAREMGAGARVEP